MKRMVLILTLLALVLFSMQQPVSAGEYKWMGNEFVFISGAADESVITETDVLLPRRSVGKTTVKVSEFNWQSQEVGTCSNGVCDVQRRSPASSVTRTTTSTTTRTSTSNRRVGPVRRLFGAVFRRGGC